MIQNKKQSSFKKAIEKHGFAKVYSRPERYLMYHVSEYSIKYLKTLKSKIKKRYGESALQSENKQRHTVTVEVVNGTQTMYCNVLYRV